MPARHGTGGAEDARRVKGRRVGGNKAQVGASGELGEPVRSYVARLITIEDILSGLPVK